MLQPFTMRILVAEDELLFAELIHRILEPALTEFKVTQTMHETMFAAEATPWDVILLDLRLLDSDVEASIDAIHRLRSLAGSPVVVVTGMPMPNLKERCLAAGAAGFVEKSVAFGATSNALRIAVIAATLHHPGQRSSALMDKVRILEGLVHAA